MAQLAMELPSLLLKAQYHVFINNLFMITNLALILAAT